jgi:hypothetical protein
MHGPAWAQYSAWLRLYRYAYADLPLDERLAIHAALNATTRLHILRNLQRVYGDVSDVAVAARRSATTALNRAVRAEKSAADYGLVVQLVLGLQIADVVALRSAPATSEEAPARMER